MTGPPPGARTMAERRTASQGHTPKRARLRAALVLHLYTLLSSLGRLYRSPVSSGMTVAVIGIALSLPAGLYVTLTNVKALSQGWQDLGEVALFLQRETAGERADELATKLRERAEIAEVRHLSPDEALADFRGLSGFGEAIEILERNPLPPVLILRVGEQWRDPARARPWLAELEALPAVDFAQFDMQWLIRFNAIMDIAQRAVYVVAGLFGLAVLLIVGNTIRLDIENRREEIEITKLVGASDGFVRRPFLYGGAWYGLLGGLLAVGLVHAALELLSGPVHSLAAAYDASFRLIGLDARAATGLLGASTLAGLLGARLAVGRHLAAVEPG